MNNRKLASSICQICHRNSNASIKNDTANTLSTVQKNKFNVTINFDATYFPSGKTNLNNEHFKCWNRKSNCTRSMRRFLKNTHIHTRGLTNEYVRGGSLTSARTSRTALPYFYFSCFSINSFSRSMCPYVAAICTGLQAR